MLVLWLLFPFSPMYYSQKPKALFPPTHAHVLQHAHRIYPSVEMDEVNMLEFWESFWSFRLPCADEPAVALTRRNGRGRGGSVANQPAAVIAISREQLGC